MMSEDLHKTLQRIRSEQRLVASNIEVLQQQIDMVRLNVMNYRTGLGVLQELRTAALDEDVLLNIGGSILVRCRLSSENRVARDIGSGVRIESTIEEAESDLRARVEALEKKLEELIGEYRRHTEYALTLSAMLQQASARASTNPEG
ncbi:MAG: prefoldin subunit alpha [Candidatus Thorarchaeota archaeon]